MPFALLSSRRWGSTKKEETQMKVIVYRKYGSPNVLELQEVEKPTPKDNEVLVKIHAASVNATDWRHLRADPFLARLHSGLLKPKYKILGADIAGRVEAVGRNVEQFSQVILFSGTYSHVVWVVLPSMSVAVKMHLC
jgi:NADPH:quinone reductase-like Zn-dependent oxidoreductase